MKIVQTSPHKDRIIVDGEDKGFSIRVGKTLPNASANLAYVKSKPISPSDNVALEDKTGEIPENKVGKDTQKIMIPDESFLLKDKNGSPVVTNEDVYISDEFSIPKTNKEKSEPLFYKMEAKGLFNAERAFVIPYDGGFHNSVPKRTYRYAELTNVQQEKMSYLGEKITIIKSTGEELPISHKYKVQLVKETGVGIPEHSCRVIVYTNFKNENNETFVLRYERTNKDGSVSKDTSEIINVHPFFKKVTKEELMELASNPKENGEWKENLFEKIYAIEHTDKNNYNVYAPSQVLVATNKNRPSHPFSYQIKADLNARFSESNKGTLKIGMAYLNDSVFNVEQINGILWKIYEDENVRPKYFEMENPHPFSGSYLKNSSEYWKIDLAMPEEYYLDYDMIILTGYGFVDMSAYAYRFRKFLEKGGKLWIDNAGSGENVLSFTKQNGEETFLTTVKFSKTSNRDGLKKASTSNLSNSMFNRLYVLNKKEINVGYSNVNPVIEFGVEENESYWDKLVVYQDETPCIIKKKVEKDGSLILSNIGMMRSLFLENELDQKLIMNMLLVLGEKRVIKTPVFKDYVYHKNNLFAEEYMGVANQKAYMDDKDVNDSSNIIAKKIISNNIKELVYPYLPQGFENANGTYFPEVDSNKEVLIQNSDFEVGTFDDRTNTEVLQWTETTANAIPNWNTNKLSGSSATFKHEKTVYQKGNKSVSIEATGEGSQAYWSHKTRLLEAGTYTIEMWVKPIGIRGVATSGAMVTVLSETNAEIISSRPIIGTMDWTRISISFTLKTSQKVQIATGFTLGKGTGKLFIDEAILTNIGDVTMNKESDGKEMLYAYATRPLEESFNLKAEGFEEGDIKIYNPDINFTYSIRAFSFLKNQRGEYVRVDGNVATYKQKINRSNGTVNLGNLAVLLPGLNDGAAWADNNTIFYEVIVGNKYDEADESQFINMAIYNKETSKYHFSKNGIATISYMDVFFGDGTSEVRPEIHLIVSTNFYTVGATKRNYGVKIKGEQPIHLKLPSKTDERDEWNVRIHSGSFTKSKLSYEEMRSLRTNEESYQRYLKNKFGNQFYNIPEYRNQFFDSGEGYIKRKKEKSTYLTSRSIQVDHSPIVLKNGSHEGTINRELLRRKDVAGYIYEASRGNWVKSKDVSVYVDENKDGNYAPWVDGFDIDYDNGCILFENEMNGLVQVTFSYEDIVILKRTYGNGRSINELANTKDRKTFYSRNLYWMNYPNPIVKVVPKGEDIRNEKFIYPIENVVVDYESGAITFKEEIKEDVIVSYHYSINRKVDIQDIDTENGIIYLKQPIHFKDEILTDYTYEEKYLHYKGYYDKALQVFFHLDLNPSAGHFCTLPVVYEKETGEKITEYEKVPSNKVLNKEIFIYLLPSSNEFGDKEVNCVRHCFSKEEWTRTKELNHKALLLGVARIRKHTNVNETIVLDARKRGGGIKESVTKKQIEKHDGYMKNYWDMDTWDGSIYYKNGTVIVEIPKEVLVEHGGTFTESDVDVIIKKYVAFGIYVVTEYI